MIIIQEYFILRINLLKNNNLPANTNFKSIILKNKKDIIKLRNYKNDYWKYKSVNLYLEKECVGIVLIVKNEIAHIRWIAKNLISKKFLEPWPIKLNFKYEACWGDAFTLPKYRRLGLNFLSISNSIKFLLENNYKYAYLTVKKKNKYNLLTYEKFDTEIYMKCKKIKIWKFVFYFNKKLSK